MSTCIVDRICRHDGITILDLTQMMLSCLTDQERQYMVEAGFIPNTSTPYEKHSMTHWVHESRDNYRWSSALVLSLCEQYTLLYDKVHPDYDMLIWLTTNIQRPPVQGNVYTSCAHWVCNRLKLTRSPPCDTYIDEYVIDGVSMTEEYHVQDHSSAPIDMEQCLMDVYTYNDTIQAIKDECGKINITYSTEGDGRIISYVNEKPYLDKLESGLKAKHPSFNIVRPKERCWYDIKINGIPINLKLTTGKTDNAFNKCSIVTVLSCSDPSISHHTTFNKLYDEIKGRVQLTERNHSTEYHYLVVHKHTGTILLKSILDIHTYKSNPSNILQINWDHEFKNSTYTCEDFKAKTKELLKTIQTSLKKQFENSKKFIESDIDNDFA